MKQKWPVCYIDFVRMKAHNDHGKCQKHEKLSHTIAVKTSFSF